jgi:hypothetical protein
MKHCIMTACVDRGGATPCILNIGTRWSKSDLDGNENVNHHLGRGFLIHKRTRSAVKRVEFVNDRMSYITLRTRWNDIIVMNVHAPTEDKSDDTKDDDDMRN